MRIRAVSEWHRCSVHFLCIQLDACKIKLINIGTENEKYLVKKQQLLLTTVVIA